MISIDTNVLLRYILADDAGQYHRARRLIEARRPVLISDVVLAEAIWTLKGKRFNLDKAGICEAIRALISDPDFKFENSQTVWSALKDFEESKLVRGKALDFADALILRKSAFVIQSKAEEFEGLFSFDKAVTQLADTHPVGP